MSTPTTDSSNFIEYAVMTYVALAAISFLGFGLLGIVHPETILNISAKSGPMNEAAKTFANLFAARNLPLGFAALLLMVMKERKALAYSSFLLGAIQAIDFVFSATGHSVATKVIPPVMAISYFICGRYLLRTA